MASSDNISSLDPWTFRSSTFPDSWISGNFARDTDILTKALQKSLSKETDTTTPPPFVHVIKPEPSPASGSEPETAPKRRNAIPSVKISKRKSRATKASLTTFITADPANFRQMVQQVTGVRLGDQHVPVVPVLKPEPQRLGNRMQPVNPTAFLLDNHQQVGFDSQGSVSFAPLAHGGAGLDFESFTSFPTLESWRVM